LTHESPRQESWISIPDDLARSLKEAAIPLLGYSSFALIIALPL
jgi:hypothetical protein